MPSKSLKATQPKPPTSLVELQSWMSQAVTTAPSKTKPSLLKKTSQFITASENLSAKERLEIYVDDYWPRCLESLAEDLPLLHAFWGEDLFDTWMTRYLEAYPSSHPSLFFLGNKLDVFLAESYNGDHPDFIRNLAHYEWTKSLLFIAKQDAPFDPAKLTKTQKTTLATLPLKLQPSTDIVVCHANYIVWNPKEAKLPKLKPCHIVIYQNAHQHLQEEVLPFAIFQLLSFLKMGQTLEESIQNLLPILEQRHIKLKEDDVQNWLGLAVQKRWLCHPNKLKKENKKGD